MRYSPLHPQPRRRLPLPMHLPIVKKSPVIAQFALPNLRRKQRTPLSGAVLHAEITCTRTALSNGQGAKLGKRFDVCIGKSVLDAAKMKKNTYLMPSQPYTMEERRGIARAS